MFSPLVGEVTAKATRTLQVSLGFGEFFINVSGAEAALPRTPVRWIIFGKRQLEPLLSSYPTKSNELQKPCGEGLLPCGRTASNSLWIQHWCGGKAETEQRVTFSLLCGWLSPGTDCLQELWSFPHWRSSRTILDIILCPCAQGWLCLSGIL